MQVTYRIFDVLWRSDSVGKDFDENGVNIECLVDGDKVWFGIRAPLLDGKAFLVGGSLSDLFRDGQSPSPATPDVIALKLSGLRTRDVAMLRDKRILVLAGAAHGPVAVPDPGHAVDRSFTTERVQIEITQTNDNGSTDRAIFRYDGAAWRPRSCATRETLRSPGPTLPRPFSRE